MGIEPMANSRQISILHLNREASAIQVRDIAVCGVLSGNLRQLMGTAPNNLGPPTDQAYSLLQTHGVIELRELPIESTEW
jgi:hypothetical protein